LGEGAAGSCGHTAWKLLLDWVLSVEAGVVLKGVITKKAKHLDGVEMVHCERARRRRTPQGGAEGLGEDRVWMQLMVHCIHELATWRQLELLIMLLRSSMTPFALSLLGMVGVGVSYWQTVTSMAWSQLLMRSLGRAIV